MPEHLPNSSREGSAAAGSMHSEAARAAVKARLQSRTPGIKEVTM